MVWYTGAFCAQAAHLEQVEASADDVARLLAKMTQSDRGLEAMQRVLSDFSAARLGGAERSNHTLARREEIKCHAYGGLSALLLHSSKFERES